MSKIVLPPLSQYQDCAAFFKDLMELNKKKHPRFSHRYLALALKWPISYTADLIQGRKRFTLSRALELAHHTKLSILDTEKLVFLALAENPNPTVKAYFSEALQSKIKRKPGAQSRSSGGPKILFDEIEIGAVHELLKWARRPLSPEEIKEALYTFESLSLKKIELILETLIEQNIIKIENEKLKILVHELVADQLDEGGDGGVRIHKNYANNFIRFTERPQFPGLFTSGFLVFQKEQFREVAHRLLEVRNWMFSLAKENDTNELSGGDGSVYQFDINLVNLIDKKTRSK